MPRVLPGEVEHGTSTAYVTYQCGCPKCAQWNRNRMQEYHQARRVHQAKP